MLILAGAATEVLPTADHLGAVVVVRRWLPTLSAAPTGTWTVDIGPEVTGPAEVFGRAAVAQWHLQEALGGPLVFATRPGWTTPAAGAAPAVHWDAAGTVEHVHVPEADARRPDLRLLLDVLRAHPVDGPTLGQLLQQVLG